MLASRPDPDSNRGIKVLQTFALPLGDRASRLLLYLFRDSPVKNFKEPLIWR